jgi:O-antigen/teichoic acid export membrane protein
MDFSYMVGSLSLLTNFAVLWAGLHLGWGVYSFAVAGIPGIFLSPIIFFILCSKSGFYPSRGNWAKPQWSNFVRVFSFGKDVALMTLGSQLVNASQIMILGRVAGLNAAATFAVGTKLFNMGQQFTGRIIESAAPALTEMFVRGDTARFRLQFGYVVALTTFLATLGAAGLVAGNTAVVALWTSDAIHWNLACDALLAGLLIATSLTRCLISIFGVVGDLRPVRHIYFAEGCLFIVLAIPATSHFGVIGLLATSLFTHLTVTAVLLARAASKAIGSISQIFSSSLAAFLITSIVFLISFFSARLATNLFSAFLKCAFMIFMAISAGWLFILPAKLKDDLLSKSRSLLKAISL